MKRLNADGYLSNLALPLIIVSTIAVAAIVFGVWAFNGRETYKNKANLMVSSAVKLAKAQEQSYLQTQFNVANENPFISYTGPQQYGSVNISYPKNWSGYVSTSGNPLDAYFNPGVVPDVGGQNSVIALRVQISSATYSQQLANYTGQQQGGSLTITPYTLKKVPSAVGVMIQGKIQPNIEGTMVLLPLRTNTLEIWTESPQYNSLFVNQILPTVTFQP